MRLFQPLTICVLALLFTAAGYAQEEKAVTTPKEQLGFNLGDDYCLANYTQLVEYWQKLERESDRVKLEVIGKTEEGRDILMAIVTSPENHKNLAKYKEISAKMALAEGLHDDEARKLAEEGKAVIWIDGGLHASEVLVAQQLMETVYQLASKQDAETLRILDDVIILCANPNPDGQELVADWYMRNKDEKKRSMQGLPRLYQKYIGHDNNRDFYMVSMKESEALCRIFYRDWFPQIIFNHHQTGPSGTVLFAPPFRGPFNHNFDPLVPLGINAVGAAIHSRFAVEGKPGATMRNGASYSTWWNGGLRTNAYFHNMIGLLTETIGSPTPMEIPLRTQRLLSTDDLPFPITPQKWHFRQSLDYSVSSNYAVLDYASRNRSLLLFNIYRMGKNSIDRGNRDHWTIRPRQIAAADQQMGPQPAGRTAADGDLPPGADAPDLSGQSQRNGRIETPANAAGNGTTTGEQQDAPTQSDDAPPQPVAESAPDSEPKTVAKPTPFEIHFRDPAARDPRGYILPSDQNDFLTATKFVNALVKNGITIHRATEWFEVAGTKYPPGSYVVKTAQAFRPHIIDMFEPQDHPDDFPYEGGPPIPPYDGAGWTLALQMGVKFDRIMDGFDGPFERMTDLIAPTPGAVTLADGAAGFLLEHSTNDAFVAMNRLLKAGETVEWYVADTTTGDQPVVAGTIYIPKQGETVERLNSIAREIGLDFEGVAAKPEGETLSMSSVRIGLWDRYGGSMPSGWVRWLLEKFEFDFRQVFAAELDQGDLRKKFDVLLFVDGAIPAVTAAGRGARAPREPNRSGIPEEYHAWLGSISAGKTIPRLKEFLEEGGTILAIGSSTSLANHLGLPLENPLVEKTADGKSQRLGPEKFFVPGSVLEVRVNNQEPLAFGMEEHMNIYFDNSPVFNLLPTTSHDQIRPVAWFDSDKSLRSGWAWGQHYLKDRATILEARVGKGRLFLYGPEITYRSQPHASFKFLFNGIHYGPAISGKSP